MNCLIDELYDTLGAFGVVGLMWGIAFIFVPIFQIIEYHFDCKKYGKEEADRIRERM